MSEELAGQVALVTGGGRGIGRAIAARFAAAGAAVTVTARAAAQLHETVAQIEQAGGRALAVPGDVCDTEAVAHAVAMTHERFGAVDVLVNNAGLPGTAGPMWEVDADAWWRCLEVNLHGPFLFARAVLPQMLARGHGRIINVTSHAGYIAYPYMSPYSVAKTALIRLSESLAFEARDAGIAVFAMDPGPVRTTMSESFFGSPAGRQWIPGVIERIERTDIPPDQAATLCLMLATGAADALSGRAIGVHDDVAGLVERAQELRETERYVLRRRT